jgi:acetyl/propionyl-CoA carboxylase alpha subunit
MRDSHEAVQRTSHSLRSAQLGSPAIELRDEITGRFPDRERRMTSEVMLPAHDDGADHGEVLRWLVEVGERVKSGQPLVAIDFDGRHVEIPAGRGGKVKAICADVGACVRTGSLLAVLE